MTMHALLTFLVTLALTAGTAVAVGVSVGAGARLDAPEPWQTGFQDPASAVMQGIINLHHDLMFFLTFVAVFVTYMLARTVMTFRKQAWVENVVHGATIEIIWTVVPSLILVAIALPSFSLLYSMDAAVDPAMTLKIIGHQWYWSYEYSDVAVTTGAHVAFDAYMVPEDDLTAGQLRLLEVDRRVVLPELVPVRLLVTAADVLHSWAMPSLGIKVDAVPGRMNQVTLLADREGTFFGQCSEICGVNHGFMPIALDIVAPERFVAWLAAQVADADGDAGSLLGALGGAEADAVALEGAAEAGPPRGPEAPQGVEDAAAAAAPAAGDAGAKATEALIGLGAAGAAARGLHASQAAQAAKTPKARKGAKGRKATKGVRIRRAVTSPLSGRVRPAYAVTPALRKLRTKNRRKYPYKEREGQVVFSTGKYILYTGPTSLTTFPFRRRQHQRHPFHLVDMSPWPLLASFMALAMTFGGVMTFHGYWGGVTMFQMGLVGVTYAAAYWWRDVVREGTYGGHHTAAVQTGLRLGMGLFIVSEVMFFLAFFWAFFHAALNPTDALGGIWPPRGIDPLNAWEVPLWNTVLLLSSGATVTVAHHALLVGASAKGRGTLALIATVALAGLFTALQGFEYVTAPFTMADNVYGSTFYMATGFHGIHVILGTTFLAVCLARLAKGHFAPNHHVGFEAAAWYWHFVDVVWLFLFVTMYVWAA